MWNNYIYIAFALGTIIRLTTSPLAGPSPSDLLKTFRSRFQVSLRSLKPRHSRNDKFKDASEELVKS
jgi:hypothetical protein